MNLAPLFEELKFVRTSLDQLKGHIQQEYAYFHGALHAEKDKYLRLEEHMKDSTELHQAQVLNLRQDIQGLEGRLQYQLREQLRDLQDVVGRVQNKADSLEKQIKEMQHIVGIEDVRHTSNSSQAFRAFVLFLQVVVTVLMAVWQVIGPCIRTRARLILMFVTLFCLFYILNRFRVPREVSCR
ncbi:unnamed protein product [Soboliphyme baturini]|uniref:Transmembrane and coiled-coil domains protein 1 n=1 Tax=Soboliphyme baturini TaxID=241478 RepID=A0A183J4N2_9BILA|nr:unnamed protein product [Soboliphyme baturini]